ncbi:DNA-binding response regulator [Paenibacillus baekrokdamisoli]|uniref:DNA-binding response regulator n=1 Tax=Paenibacillus baekrokdamisoli TaxID=1712516 RepID=A0A3G9IVZ8_9BACL|nr:response regulator [Paenibacillus baekrokdamisoli]MBB3067886.1 two-component system response regulator YesN [Paenibacillus baekrokdamisoli]BBH23067.1 DNA-binding response regulator [Paenibacillus baekrokdamisoli]
MIKLFVVDDEEEIRRGIIENTDWEGNGIVICGEADNGDDALTLIEESEPDILLIDVRMPGLSGLQVVESLQSTKRLVKSIILSGYDDFSYAQKALKSGACDYLLKPCRSKDILEAVLKVKELILVENTHVNALEKLKTQYQEGLPLIKEKFLLRMLNNRLKINAKLLQNFEILGLKIKPTNFAVIVIQIIDFHSYAEQHSYQDIELMKYAMKNIVIELIQHEYDCEICEDAAGFSIIANCRDGSSERLVPLFETINSNTVKYLGFSLLIGIGTYYRNIEDLIYSYDEAMKCLEFAFILGNNKVLHYSAIPKFGQTKSVYPINEEKRLIESVASGRSEDLTDRLEAYLSILVNNNPSKDYIQKSCLALIVSLYHLCLDKDIDPEKIFGSYFSSLDHLVQFHSLNQIKEKVTELVGKVTEAIQRSRHSNRIIMVALKYIEDHYNGNLTLELVANQVYVNPKYLSMLFKQTTGENFVDYIQTLRIEKACELLKDLKLKTYEVANQVGYSDEKYFSHIFKKIKGMPPSQFRDHRL